VVISDLDRDGSPEIVVANDGEANFLFTREPAAVPDRGSRALRYRECDLESGLALCESGFAQANMGIAIGDYLHTGRMSLVISHFDSEYATLYRNDGDMNFAEVSGPSGVTKSTRGMVQWGDAFVDFANKGWQDLFVVSGHVYPQVDTVPLGTRYREPKVLLRNEHNGRFTDVSKEVGPAIQIPQVSRGMAIGDLFNDGKLDAVVENLVGLPMILRPMGGPHNHWISLQLEGVKSNRLALNARVRATAGDLVQLGEVVSGGSYLSQNDLRIHFGLGQHDHVEKIEISWLGGKTEILSNLAADRLYVVREGEGVVSSRAAEPDRFSHF